MPCFSKSMFRLVCVAYKYILCVIFDFYSENSHCSLYITVCTYMYCNNNNSKYSSPSCQAISSSLTHYAPVPPAWSPVSSSQPYSLAMPLPISSASQHQSPFENDQVVASSMPNPDHHRGNTGFAFASAPNTPKDRDSVLVSVIILCPSLHLFLWLMMSIIYTYCHSRTTIPRVHCQVLLQV